MRSARGTTEKAVRSAPFRFGGAAPHMIEGELHVACSRSFDRHRRIAPACAVLLENARRPLAPDSDAARDPERGVDDEKFSVVPRNETEPAPKSRRIEDGDLDSS